MTTPAHHRRHIAVIGGGWAGHAAAVTLAKQGCQVSVYEASRTTGGRARSITFAPVKHLPPVTLDNGQHILLGAYTTTFSLLKTVGIASQDAFLRLPLQMCYPSHTGIQFEAPRLPAPWHLAIALWRAQGLSGSDKMALMRFFTSARWMKWTLYDDCTVTELLERFDQTDHIIRLLWAPLCVAALNTPIHAASAQLFLHVLRDSLGAKRSASDMLMPRMDLSALFPDAAARFITTHGGAVYCGTAVDSILPADNAALRWDLFNKEGSHLSQVDGLVIATPPESAAQLLDGKIDTTPLRAFDYEPITTCYLQYTQNIRLDRAFYALATDEATRSWGQFVFDRAQMTVDTHHTPQDGLLAVIISAASHAIEQGHAVLADDVARQLATVFQQEKLLNPLWTKIISEKRATFAATPGLLRPPNATAIANVVLAGDYTASDYPATLESAMRSGKDAANILLQTR